MLALDEFISKGYYGTSTREISKIAGISSGLMFYYFDSKLALYEALIEIGCNEMGKWIPEEDCDPMSVLEEIIRGIFSGIEHNSYFCNMFIFMDQAQRTPEVSERINTRLAEQDITKHIVPLVKNAQKAGFVKEGDPVALSIALSCAVQGIAQRKADAPDSVMPEADWILDIIRK